MSKLSDCYCKSLIVKKLSVFSGSDYMSFVNMLLKYRCYFTITFLIFYSLARSLFIEEPVYIWTTSLVIIFIISKIFEIRHKENNKNKIESDDYDINGTGTFKVENISKFVKGISYYLLAFQYILESSLISDKCSMNVTSGYIVTSICFMEGVDSISDYRPEITKQKIDNAYHLFNNVYDFFKANIILFFIILCLVIYYIVIFFVLVFTVKI